MSENLIIENELSTQMASGLWHFGHVCTNSHVINCENKKRNTRYFKATHLQQTARNLALKEKCIFSRPEGWFYKCLPSVVLKPLLRQGHPKIIMKCLVPGTPPEYICTIKFEIFQPLSRYLQRKNADIVHKLLNLQMIWEPLYIHTQMVEEINNFRGESHSDIWQLRFDGSMLVWEPIVNESCIYPCICAAGYSWDLCKSFWHWYTNYTMCKLM